MKTTDSKKPYGSLIYELSVEERRTINNSISLISNIS